MVWKKMLNSIPCKDVLLLQSLKHKKPIQVKHRDIGEICLRSIKFFLSCPQLVLALKTKTLFLTNIWGKKNKKKHIHTTCLLQVSWDTNQRAKHVKRVSELNFCVFCAVMDVFIGAIDTTRGCAQKQKLEQLEQ